MLVGLESSDSWFDWGLALCRGTGLAPLFFSEQLDEIARAKAICQDCAVIDDCLQSALERREACGVWGGELILNGVVLANKRKRGRPPKIASVA